ncbi:MAG: RNA-binding protein [Clostridia bacterium]|nr:RNA-binding protein [Clostridia bacterium]
MDAKKRFSELAMRAAFTGVPQFTRFLEPSMERDALSAAHAAGASVSFSGGYEGAERRMAAFHDGDAPEDYPIAALELRWNAKFADAKHRDLLGAVMGLGLERDATGDVCLGQKEGVAYLFCTEDVAGYISGNLESAGRASLKIERAGEIDIAPPEGSEMRVTVQNLRMDAVLAAGYKLSRSEAQKLIAAGLVKLNHVIEMRSDARVEAGHLISARGYGRLRIDEIQGETKKGRIGVMLFRYGK